MVFRTLPWFLFSQFLVNCLAFKPLLSYLNKPVRITLSDQLQLHQIENQYFNVPTFENYGNPRNVSQQKPIVRVDFGIFKNEISTELIEQGVVSAFQKTRVRFLHSDLYYTDPNAFHLRLYFPTGKLRPDGSQYELMDSADIYDSNFPCNDADEDTVRAWAHNGRQIMYSVYFDETIEDMIYVFVNVDDDICEYHVKYDELRGNDVNPPKARFKRFKGPHLTAPAGYKVLHPFMSVDSAMRTYNYLVVNLEGPIDVKMITYRLHSSGENKPLRWEKYDISNDLITRFQHQKFYGSEGTGQKYDYHTLDFLRNYDFRVDQGGCPQNLNALMSTFDCVNFISAHYHGYEVYALAGRSARKMPCQPPAHPLYHGISRNAMFLETGHCKNSKVRI